MQIKKVVGLVLLSATLSFGSMASIFTGENVTKSEYKNGERGIIVKQDIDADGIIDSKDDCLETIPCKEEGCKEPEPKPVVIGDDDKDGVLNNLDKCPNTSAGIKVNKDGCVEVVNLNINFDNNSAEIKNQYRKNLETFANTLKQNKSLTAVIEAHTDSKGSDAYNQNLSDRRAVSVLNALKALDIKASRLSSIGYGESQPIATNDTEEGKALNRRVTALVNQ